MLGPRVGDDMRIIIIIVVISFSTSCFESVILLSCVCADDVESDVYDN